MYDAYSPLVAKSLITNQGHSWVHTSWFLPPTKKPGKSSSSLPVAPWGIDLVHAIHSTQVGYQRRKRSPPQYPLSILSYERFNHLHGISCVFQPLAWNIIRISTICVIYHGYLNYV